MTATTSIYDGDYDSVDIDDDNSLTADKDTRPRGKTLTFLKELRNITKNAGDSLRLRCEVTGTAPATSFRWYKNDAPLIEEKNRMKIKSKLNGATQYTMLKFKTVETLDTAFYECRASNDIDEIKSVAIITVERAKPGSSGGFLNRNNGNPFDNDENLGKIPWRPEIQKS